MWHVETTEKLIFFLWLVACGFWLLELSFKQKFWKGNLILDLSFMRKSKSAHVFVAVVSWDTSARETPCLIRRLHALWKGTNSYARQ